MKRALPLVLALALTACGGGGSSDLASADEWAGELCKALAPLPTQGEELQKSLTETASQVASDPAGVRDEFVAALKTLEGTFQDAVDATEKAGAPDVDNGEQVQKETLAGLRGAVDTLKAAQDKLQAVDATPQGVGGAFVDVGTDISDGFEKFGETFENLDKNKELSKAGDENEDCKKLDES